MFSRKYFAITAAVCLLVTFVQADQLYKIVDEKGNITYSQFPPAEKPAKSQVEGVQVAGESQSTVTQHGGDEYCGSIKLTRANRYSNRKSSLPDAVQQRQEYWQSELTQKVEDMDRRHRYAAASNRPASSNNDLGDLQQIRDYRCAINWAKEEAHNMDDAVRSHSGEKERLQGVYAKVEGQLARSCGEKPELDPTDPRNNRLRAEWYDCSKSYLDNMRKLRSEMNLY